MKKTFIFKILLLTLFILGCNSKNRSKLEDKGAELEKTTTKKEPKVFESDFFEFDLSFTDFNHAKTQFGTITFNEDGDFESVNNLSNTIEIGRLPKMTEQERTEFIISLYPTGDDTYEEIKSTQIQNTVIGNYNANILDTPYVFDNVEGIMYFVILDGEEWSLAFTGRAFGDGKQDLLEKYKKTVKSIRLK
ncbi:hypothetical protein [[Muricauda] lutisoli]|uniref:Lipoprotein n=1 Tax=[Muricauda] lutisoli TaxID=2816035 RepID=A0ABS3EWB0_9FLAO|nr:hypothetical protein [[Muricauda] lutisoli]MBO0330508.1 hypothetical protein [[Muricauda] lutisoli]